jgi:hypothetical protein
MTGVGEIATALMCSFGRSLWGFLCTLDEKGKEINKFTRNFFLHSFSKRAIFLFVRGLAPKKRGLSPKSWDWHQYRWGFLSKVRSFIAIE